MRHDQVVTVQARPGPFSLQPSLTSVVVVDMQNDFGSPGGMFDNAGIDITPIRAIIEPTSQLLSAARRHGMKIVYLKMGFLPDLSDAGHPTSPTWLKHRPLKAGDETTAPDGTPSRVLVRDTWNTEIIDELTPCADDEVIYKSRYSGFYNTDLADRLRAAGIETLVVVGATTSVCVDSTVRDAMIRDLHCLVLSDCTAEPIGNDLPRSNHEASLLTIELLLGHVTTSRALLAALGTGDDTFEGRILPTDQ